MEGYRILVDLSADIKKEVVDKYNIGFIPMNYSIDEKEYLSDKFLTEDEMFHFYRNMETGSITKTSQITPFMYKEFLKPYIDNKENVLYFSLSISIIPYFFTW